MIKRRPDLRRQPRIVYAARKEHRSPLTQHRRRSPLRPSVPIRDAGYDPFWHFSDMALALNDVCSSGDNVAKVFFGRSTKILRTADPVRSRRREGPYRFVQNRPRTFVAALNSEAAADKSKNQLSRDF